MGYALRILSVMFVMCSVGHIASAQQPPVLKNCSMVIGRRCAVIHERYEVTLFVGEQQIVFDQVPASVDLSSLVVKDRRVPLVLKDWEKVQVGTPQSLENRSSLVWNRATGWQGNQADGVSWGGVACRIESPMSGKRIIDLVYCATGIAWKAFYTLRTRGDLKRSIDKTFAVDLRGVVTIHNSLARTFSNATVFVSGGETVAEDISDDPGFLSLSDSPLADLWKQQQPRRSLENIYAVPERHTLAACQQTSLALVDVMRLPARRYYWLFSDELSTTARGAGVPLHEIIVFDNSTENHLGIVLPPGDVMVQRAGALRYQISHAEMSHAQPLQPIYIDIGLDSSVTATRTKISKVELEGQTFKESYRIQLNNRHDWMVEALINENPPTLLKWSVVSVNAQHTRNGRTLEMPATVLGKESTEIDYTIQVEQPVLW